MSQGNPTDIEINIYSENYILHGDQSRSWRVTFPNSKSKPENVHTKASLMHSNTKVKQRIEQLRGEANQVFQDKFTITIDQRLKWLEEVVTAGLSQKKDDQGNVIGVRENLAAVNKAVEVLNTMLGTSQKGDSIKPVKVFVGVQDAS